MNELASIERTVDRHEGIIELLRECVGRIESSLSEIKTQLRSHTVPGKSDFCKERLQRIEEAHHRIDGLQEQLNDLRRVLSRWCGGLAVLTFLVGATLAVLKIVL